MCDYDTIGRIEYLESMVVALIQVTQWNAERRVGKYAGYGHVEGECDFGEPDASCNFGKIAGVAYVYGTKAVVPLWVNHGSERELVAIDIDRIQD